MGWVQKVELKPTASGRVRHSYRAGYRDPDGKIVTKQFARSHDAQAWLRDKDAAIVRGDYTDPALGREPFGAFFEHTLRTADLRPKTLAEYRGLMDRHVMDAWENRPLNSIHQADVKDLLAKVGDETGTATVHAVYRVIRRTLQIAVDEGRLARNPAARIKVARATRGDIRVLSPDELAALAAAVDDRFRALVLVLGYGGLRIGEASALRVGDVDPARGRLTIERSAVEVDGVITIGPPKSGKARAVDLPSFVRDVLVEHLARYTDPTARGSLVFTGQRGKPIRATLFGRRVLTPAAKAAGISPAPRTHDLRHTAVAIAISAGWHPRAIQELAGHSSIQVTFDVYGHLFDTLHEAGLERLDEIARGAKVPEDAVVLDATGRASSRRSRSA